MNDISLAPLLVQCFKLAADDSKISEMAFTALVEDACAVLLNETSEKILQRNPMLKDVDATLLKELLAGVMSALVEASKRDMQGEQLASLLAEQGLSSGKISAVTSAFNDHRDDIRSHLCRIGRRPRNIVDASWRLDYNTRNSHSTKIGEIRYTITLKTDSAAGDDVTFTCTKDELQDLIAKLKGASKALERASS